MQVSKRILILCEDKKSSKLYLKSFKSDEELKRKLAAVDIEICHPKDYSPLGLVKEAKAKKSNAKRERNAYDEVWIVLDKDKHYGVPDAINIAKANGINVALSIICFEYWVLLHFEKTRKAFYNCEELNKYLRNQYFPEYLKSDNCFEILKERITFAIKNGEWLEKEILNDLESGRKFYELSAYTNMHNLVKQMFFPDEFLFKE